MISMDFDALTFSLFLAANPHAASAASVRGDTAAVVRHAQVPGEVSPPDGGGGAAADALAPLLPCVPITAKSLPRAHRRVDAAGVVDQTVDRGREKRWTGWDWHGAAATTSSPTVMVNGTYCVAIVLLRGTATAIWTPMRCAGCCKLRDRGVREIAATVRFWSRLVFAAAPISVLPFRRTQSFVTTLSRMPSS